MDCWLYLVIIGCWGLFVACAVLGICGVVIQFWGCFACGFVLLFVGYVDGYFWVLRLVSYWIGVLCDLTFADALSCGLRGVGFVGLRRFWVVLRLVLVEWGFALGCLAIVGVWLAGCLVCVHDSGAVV